jgi:BioD-like phosphotransacetylase family protein
VVIASGGSDCIVDDIAFLKRYLGSENVPFAGLIINKIRDVDDFKETHLPIVEEMGVKVLGVIPFVEDLTHFSVRYIADKLFAKVLAGEEGLSGVAEQIAVGAMSVDAVLKAPVFLSESKLVVTSGDRSDMILAALETKSSAIVLTNDILPPANIISMADDMKTPLLLVRSDTYATAKQLDDMEPLTVKDDVARGNLMAELVREHVELGEIL